MPDDSQSIGFVERSVCPVCCSADSILRVQSTIGSPKVWEFVQTYYQGRVRDESIKAMPYEIAECKQCNLLYQKQILNDFGMFQLYEKWINNEDSLNKRKLADLHYYTTKALRMHQIIELINKSPHEIRVLDYGMGWGHWCLMANAFGMQSIGQELSQDRLGYAQSRGLSTIREVDRSGEHFDFINTEQVFEHLPHPRETLELLTDVLKPNGYLRISVPNAETDRATLCSDFRPRKDAFHPLEHVNAFSHSSLIYMAKQAKLKLVRTALPILTHRPSLRNVLRVLKRNVMPSNPTNPTDLIFKKQ